jgi:hypothetical protein
MSFSTLLSPIALVVYGVLLRAPDRQGLPIIGNGPGKGFPAGHRAAFARSAEHRASTGENRGLAPKLFVNRAYQDILGRCPDQAGLEAYARLAARRGGGGGNRPLAGSASPEPQAHEPVEQNPGLACYARHRFLRDLPVIGSWLERGRKRRERIDKIAANQRLRRPVAEAAQGHGSGQPGRR